MVKRTLCLEVGTRFDKLDIGTYDFHNAELFFNLFDV